MLIDCDGCAVRGVGCDDCVVTVLLGGGGAGSEPAVPAPVELDESELLALGVLADGGLVPQLRMTTVPPEWGRAVG